VRPPHVAADVPAGWVATDDVAKPKIAEASGAAFVQWQASQSANGDAALVSGCVATPIPGWVEDMRPAVEARTVALAGAATSKIAGGPIDARPAENGVLALRAASDVTGPVIGRARTFVGFDESHVLTCFATCAAKSIGSLRHEPSGSLDACERAVTAARLEGALPPPEAGVALRAATWAVHHPRPAAMGGLAFVVVLGILTVVVRRRPRSRIERAPRAPERTKRTIARG